MSTGLQPSIVDDPIWGFSDLLRLAGLPRGAAEGYIQRGIVTLAQRKKTGKGHHRGYTGREIIKFAAIKYLTRAGVEPSQIKWLVSNEVTRLAVPKLAIPKDEPQPTNPNKVFPIEAWAEIWISPEGQIPASRADSPVRKGPLDRVIDAFLESGQDNIYASKSPFVLNSCAMAKEPRPGLIVWESIQRMAAGMREDHTISYVVFDAFVFVTAGIQILENAYAARNSEQDK